MCPKMHEEETNPSSKEVEPALEPCPFCGRKSMVEEFRNGDDPEPLFVATCEICPVKTYDQFSAKEAARVWNTRVSADSAGAMVDKASLKKLARRLIDAVINSPCVIEVRMFSQPEAVENLEDAIIKLMRAATPPAPKKEEAQGWQPIETAPRELISDGYASKHGPRILAFPVRGIVAGVRWFQSKVTPNAVGFVSDWQEVCEPTHWMPLPPAPLVSDCDPDG